MPKSSPVFLPGKPDGQKRLAGGPGGRKESNKTEAT